MIPVEIAIAIGVSIAVLTIYTFIDLENRIYANIIACFFAIILCSIMALFLFSGNVVSISSTISGHNTTVATVDNTTYTNESYSYSGTVFQIINPAFGWFFFLWGTALVIIFILLVLDAWYEHIAEDGEEE